MSKPIKVCIISSQILGPEKTGGFGSMTKQLAVSLARKGLEVIVVVLKRKGQEKVDYTQGFKIIRLSKTEAINPFTYRKLNADIYHSQNPNLMSTAAILGARNKKHVITCRDPRDFKDWLIEIRDATWKRKLKNIPLAVFEEGPIIKWTIKRADKAAYAAHWLKGKIERMYKPKNEPVFLPNIEDVPEEIPQKAEGPTVCFVGRLDGRKRPELFIELVGKFPHVTFLMAGKAEEEQRQRKLDKMASNYKNLKMFGYVDKFKDREFYGIYNRSWIFVNTASREAMPLTFIEAAGRGCAILSYVDPDGFASKFGFWARKNNFEEGLKYLLENNRWREQGRKAHEYVYDMYGAEKAVNAHISCYKQLLKSDDNNEI